VRTEREWGAYDRWGSAIAEEFFGGRYGSRPVYLDLEEEALGRIAASIGIAPAGEPPEKLIEAVRATLPLDRDGPLFAEHAERLAVWQGDDRSTPPPVIALLAYFSLVAERMRSDGDLAASNYYGRFVSMLGGDPLDEDIKHRVFRAFADNSGKFWSALNAWLQERPEVRGLPTAFAFDRRAYVGPALSQALVRDSDRRELLRLLAEAGLRPGQTVAVEDMTRLLEERLSDAPLSIGLKRLAATPDVLARIAEVACVELAAWSGAAEDAGRGAGATGRIAIWASLRRIPRRSLRLGIAAVAPERVTTLAPGPECDEAGRAALGAAGGSVGLEPADPDGWRAAAGTFGIADLLASRLELAGEEGYRARRRPLPVVVLAREGASDIYREVERVSLTAQHMLLVVESSRERLDGELESIARAGYSVHESVPGLPRGWLLYEGVEVVGITETTAPDLAVLVPLAWTEVTLDGGMRLPGRSTWHSRSAPKLKATAPPGRAALARLHGPGEESHDLGHVEGALIVDLDDLELEDGQYRIELLDVGDERVLSTVAMNLRCADTMPPDSSAPVERGPASGSLWPLTSASDGLPAGDEAEEEDDEAEEASPATVEAPPCYLSGAHHIVLPPAGRDDSPRRGETIEGECRYCGLEKRFPARPWRARRHRGGGRPPAARPVAVPALPEERQIDYDLLLDALSLIGCGRADRVRSLLDGLDIEPWAPSEALRTLSALGHLDVGLDRQLRPANWRVAPPAVVLGEGEPFLAGFRSERLLYGLGNATELRYEPQHEAPERVLLPGLASESAERLATRIDLPLRILESPARSLVSALPDLLTLRAALPPLQGPPHRGSIERLEGNRWRPVDLPSADGGYRTKRMPRLLWHRRGQDLRVTDSRLVRWLSAPPRELMTIGPDDQVTCRLGAKPPWLYERALALASGLAPRPGTDRTVIYQGVPAELAEGLLAAMTGQRIAAGV
jgi:hypothetical protein